MASGLPKLDRGPRPEWCHHIVKPGTQLYCAAAVPRGHHDPKHCPDHAQPKEPRP